MHTVFFKNSLMKMYRTRFVFLIIALLPISLFFHAFAADNVPARENASARENAANIWYFGDGAGLDFNAGIDPTALTDNVALNSGGSAVISDQDGNLLFYTDGSRVWNNEHAIMPRGSSLLGGSYADQPAMIVPNPGDPERYYVFTVSARLGLFYSEVNMALDAGAGDVMTKNVGLWSAAAGKITAVSHANATDFWVIAPSTTDNTLHAYLVTASGVNHTPVVSRTGIGHSRCEFDFTGYLKAAPDGSRLALSVVEPGFFEIFDFDPATGRVFNPLFLGDYEGASGIEFSPDSSKLYATVVNWVHKEIYQFDLEAQDIPGSVQVIGESPEENRLRALQVGPDGRVYVARENAIYAGVINYPNRLGPDCEYVDEGVSLKGRVGRNDLPNFAQSFFKPPVITLSIHDTVVNEADKTATFTVSLSDAGRSNILADYVSRPGTAQAEIDYKTTSGMVIIPEGATEGHIVVRMIDDDVFDEGPETFSIELSNPVRAVLADDHGIGTIQENDLVELAIADADASEGDGGIEFTIGLSQASRSEVSVDYTTHDGTATAGSEYTTASGTVTIPAGQTAGTLMVSVLDDTLDEQDATLLVSLSNPVNAAMTDDQAVGTITDDDAPPTLSIQDQSIDEQADTMTFTVNLSTVSMLDLTVDYTTRDATTTAGSDYTATSGTMFIPAGRPFGIIMVDIRDDALNEGDEAFVVELGNPVNATIADAQGLGTITDTDPLPEMSIDDVTQPEGAGVLPFVISLSAVSGRDVSVTYATGDDTALADGDYVAASGTVTIPAGTLSVPLSVTIVDDPHEERDETLTLRLSAAVNAALVDERGVGTMTNDDPPPTMEIDDATADEDAGAMTFTVSLSHASYQDIAVNYVTTDGSATIAGNDYVLRPETALTIPAGATGGTITVQINEDALIEGPETLRVVLARPVNATIADGEGIGEIRDNDALPAMSIDDVTVDEGAHALTFTVSLSEASQLPVIVSYATHDGTAGGDSDYVPINGTMAIAPDSLSGTIVVPIIDDALAESAEAFSLRLHTVHNATLAKQRGTGTITDNDG